MRDNVRCLKNVITPTIMCMKNRYRSIVLLLLMPHCLMATTLVYNMRIRRAFTLGAAFIKRKKAIWVATGLPIFYKRERDIVDMQRGFDFNEHDVVGGSLFNVRYISPHSWWVEATTGIAKERNYVCGTPAFNSSRVGFDDVVLSGGYNMQFDANTQFVVYGLTGFPTRREVTLEETFNTFVGTRFFSLGVGTEFSYSFINTLKESLVIIFQNRFLHFFDRCWFPILPRNATIEPGNATDLLFTLQYRHKRNILESGYNPTFFTNQAVVVDGKRTESESFVRQGFYINYAHICKKFSLFDKQTIVGTGFNMGKTNRFDTQQFIWWTQLSVVF